MTDKPKTWGEMSDAEKGALLLAHHEGKVIQSIYLDEGKIAVWETKVKGTFFNPNMAYRVKPEPKRETMAMWSNSSERILEFSFLRLTGDTHRLTLDLIDNEPDCTKCPTCGTAKHVDLERIK